MGKHSDYRKDKAFTAWDMTKFSRQYVSTESKRRRKLRDILRRQNRKRIAARSLKEMDY